MFFFILYMILKAWLPGTDDQIWALIRILRGSHRGANSETGRSGRLFISRPSEDKMIAKRSFRCIVTLFLIAILLTPFTLATAGDSPPLIFIMMYPPISEFSVIGWPLDTTAHLTILDPAGRSNSILTRSQQLASMIADIFLTVRITICRKMYSSNRSTRSSPPRKVRRRFTFWSPMCA